MNTDVCTHTYIYTKKRKKYIHKMKCCPNDTVIEYDTLSLSGSPLQTWYSVLVFTMSEEEC